MEAIQGFIVLEQYVGGGRFFLFVCFKIIKKQCRFYQCVDKLMLPANLRFDPRSQGPCKKKTMLSTSNRGRRGELIGSDLYPLGGPHYIYCQKPVMCITCIYERHFEVPFMPAHPAPEGDVSAQMKTTFVSLRRDCAHA